MITLAQELNNDTVSPGLLGTLVVACMGVALVFLIKSMNKRIARIQAPRQADLDQAAWEAEQAEARKSETGEPETREPEESGARRSEQAGKPID